MRTYILQGSGFVVLLLLLSLTGCKKTTPEDAAPELTCQTAEYGTADNSGKLFTYEFRYFPGGKPSQIEAVNLKSSNQKTVWAYAYQENKSVIITQTLDGKPYAVITLTLDTQGRATHREDVFSSGTKVTNDYAYDGAGYLAKIQNSGGEIILTNENGFLRTVKNGSSTYAVTSSDQIPLKQVVPLGFINLHWPFLYFLGKPFRGPITGYQSAGYKYEMVHAFNGQGGLISREILYTDLSTNKTTTSLNETFTTLCQ